MQDITSKINLTSYDDLFETDQSRADNDKEKIVHMPINEISSFPNHPFKVKNDEALLEMAESIKTYGVLVPGIVRPNPNGNGYEMIAGHRRSEASKIAGVETIPVVVRNMDDNAATIVMVDSNMQRENLLPSEKAFAYKMKLDAMKRQAGRPGKENVSQVGTQKRSDQILAEKTGDSRNQIHRYIRLTELNPTILEMVDDKKIAFNSAVEISYLNEREQKDLLETMETEECTPLLEQAERMKQLSKDNRLNIDVIFSIMTELKPNQKEKITFKQDEIQKYFPKSFTPQQISETIIKLLEKYKRQRERDNER